MSHIVLFCAGGMSTSLLVNRMKDAAKVMGVDHEIEAHGLTSIEKYAPDADVILLGPQVRYAEKQLKEKFPEKKIAPIDMKDYGTMNGKAVLETAQKMLSE